MHSFVQWFLFLQLIAKVRGTFSFDTKREPEKCIALRGVTFCLFSACKDAPLGKRRLPGTFSFDTKREEKCGGACKA